MDHTITIDALRQSVLFGVLPEAELEKIARRAKMRQFFANDVIVWQGQPSTALFLIINGIVAVKTMGQEKENIFAYLMPGNTFGEVGILENEPRSANVEALSEVDVLVLQREDFLDILEQQPKVAIELARILGRYLVQANRRISDEHRSTKLILIFRTESNSGATTLGTLLAAELVKLEHKATGYLEYPNPFRALGGHQLPKGTQVYHHAEGYDILLPQEESYLPTNTRTTLMLDKMRSTYDNLVIQVPDTIDEGVAMMLEHASLVVIMSPPSASGRKKLEHLHRRVQGRVRPEETGIITVINHNQPHDEFFDDKQSDIDHELPFVPNFPILQISEHEERAVPDQLQNLIRKCVERIERTNSLGIIIPTTTNGNEATDTAPYVDEAMSFMAERFKGATCKEANGIWHSEKLGLVGEVVYIVHSYATSADMNRYLDELVEYTKKLKRELRQEAMALEVNHKLTLI
jgi:CRP-like cAMP-binding protein